MSIRILGLDASTKTVGWNILECEKGQNKKLVTWGAFSPPDKNKAFKPQIDHTVFEKLVWIKEKIRNLVTQYDPHYVGIEDFSKFMPKKTRADTIIALAVWNRTVCLTILETIGVPPTPLNVLKIRHTIKENKQLPAKEDIPELVKKILKLDNFPYLYEESGKHKGEIAEESYDIADSIAVSLTLAKIKNL